MRTDGIGIGLGPVNVVRGKLCGQTEVMLARTGK